LTEPVQEKQLVPPIITANLPGAIDREPLDCRAFAVLSAVARLAKNFEILVGHIPRLSTIPLMVNVQGQLVVSAPLAAPSPSLQSLKTAFLPARVFEFLGVGHQSAFSKLARSAE
jgi:hypothetical protein